MIMTRKSQSGLSLVSVLLVGGAMAALVVLGLKLIPVVNEYFGIKRALAAVVSASNPQSATVSELRNAFSKRVTVDDITSVTPADIDITKENGRIVMSVDYARKVPLYGKVSLLIEFSASSDAN
ncbi:hypothetical protein GCM10007933_09910 [Zoogloea oryzae]|uniref:DUF4845 domain-containing protein n=2 Tax=Zoogloea oryzae TaxID=310767 RepID=A0ABQ6F8E9_9RHOO|nr:hypothetical protein GCM10007933_09910 [Zoogloea oryzae]